MEYLMLVQVTKFFCPPGSALAWRSGSAFAKHARAPGFNPRHNHWIEKVDRGGFQSSFFLNPYGLDIMERAFVCLGNDFLYKSILTHCAGVMVYDNPIKR